MFTFYLFGIDRQVYYRKIRRKINKQIKAEQVVSMVIEIRKSNLDWVQKSCTIFYRISAN